MNFQLLDIYFHSFSPANFFFTSVSLHDTFFLEKNSKHENEST